MRKSMETQVKETDMQIVRQVADESYFKGYLDALYAFAWRFPNVDPAKFFPEVR